MIKTKINVLSELKKRGFSSTKLRNEKIFAESTMTNLRNNTIKTIEQLNTICSLLSCQPGEIIEFIPDNTDLK